MFKDLKEYQDITRIYNESVNISEEQRAINKIFVEEGFTVEELDYLEENWDELWENELAQFTQECISESFEGQNLTEEQIQQIDEVLGLGLAAKGIAKLAPKAVKGLRMANVGIKKGLKSVGKKLTSGAKAVGTGIKDTARGALSVGKSALKKVGGAIKKAAPIIGKGALLGTGAALPLAGGFAAVNALRNRGKKEREAAESGKAAGDAAKKIADAKAKGKEAGDAAKKLADAGAAAGGASEVKGGNKGGTKVGEAGAAAAQGAQDAKGTKGNKKLLSTPMKDTTELGSKVRQVKPGSSRDKMIAKNEARHGKDSITNRRNMNADFQAYKKGKITKAQFIDKYPKSITAQRAQGLRDHTEWDAYDMVLEYLFSTDQVATLEEANYVMMEMDQQTIGEIVTEVKQELHELLPLAGLALGALGVNKLRKRGKAKREAGKAAAGAVGGAAGKAAGSVGGAAGKGSMKMISRVKNNPGGAAGKAAGAVGGALAGAAGSKGSRKIAKGTGGMASVSGRAAGPKIGGKPIPKERVAGRDAGRAASRMGTGQKSKVDLSGKTKAQIMALKRLGKI